MRDFFLSLSYSFIKLTLGTFVKLIWVKEVEGIKNIPQKGPVIVAFNHQSFFDFLCFVSVCPRKVSFLSAEKFFSHMLWAPLMKLTGQIKVERKKHDKRGLHDVIYNKLQNGEMIGIFPEGTRSPFEDEMLYAFTGVAKYAIRGEAPILPVGIRGTYSVMAKHDRRPKFKKIVSIHVGELMHFKEYRKSKLNKKSFRVLTDKVMIEISRLSIKRYSYVGVFK